MWLYIQQYAIHPSKIKILNTRRKTIETNKRIRSENMYSVHTRNNGTESIRRKKRTQQLDIIFNWICYIHSNQTTTKWPTERFTYSLLINRKFSINELPVILFLSFISFFSSSSFSSHLITTKVCWLILLERSSHALTGNLFDMTPPFKEPNQTFVSQMWIFYPPFQLILFSFSLVEILRSAHDFFSSLKCKHFCLLYDAFTHNNFFFLSFFSNYRFNIAEIGKIHGKTTISFNINYIYLYVNIWNDSGRKVFTLNLNRISLYDVDDSV